LNDLWTGHQASVTDREGTTVTIVNQFDDKPMLVAVNGGFRPGNWDFFAHLVYVFGTREFKTGGVSDSDYSAYVLEAYAKYNIGPGMSALIEGFYSTGNDADDPDKIKYFPTAKGSEARSIFGNDRTVFFWMNAAQIGYYHDREIDFSGLYYGRFAFEYSPTAWVRFILNYLYIGDTSKGSPGTYSPKINPGASVTKVVNSPKGSRQDVDEDFVGHEINLITTLNIYKGFVYNIGIYYFLPGEVWDSPTKDAEASYGINTKLVYAF
jgi:hypothetical protein